MCSETETSRVRAPHSHRITFPPRWVLFSALGLLVCTVIGTPMLAQDAGHIFGNQQILNIAQSLRARLEGSKRDGTGLAEERLDEVSFVAVRVKSGRAEVHKSSDDIFVVLSGEATLVTGGKVIDPSGDREIRGNSIEGGTWAKLAKGQVVHIPQAVPHQLLLPAGETLVYVLIKIPR